MTSTAVLFGVPLDGLTTAESLERIDDLVHRGRAENRTFQVATVNVDFLVNALEDPAVMNILRHADLNLADGMPVLWASRLIGTPLPERVAGADLVGMLPQASNDRGWRVHLFGAGPGVADRARSIMTREHPTAMITSDSGPLKVNVDEVDDAIVDRIQQVDPDVLCVALGNPKQERFIATYRHVLRCPVMIGIGGSLDMLVGDKQRAPSWAQRLGTEWVFRAAQEPRRLGRRYAHDFAVFGPHLARYLHATRRYRNSSSLRFSRIGERVNVITDASGTSTQPATSALDLLSAASIEINLASVNGLTPLAHAQLIGLIRRAHEQSIPVRWVHVSQPLLRCLEAYGTRHINTPSLTEY